jgi:hypothetical protein
MSPVNLIIRCRMLTLVVLVLGTAGILVLTRPVHAQDSRTERGTNWRRVPQTRFEVDVLVDGRSVAEYYARGRTYVEALEGAEYELRIKNPLPERVAVALSVDGLNTIDARHTSPWNASKWVIEPYGTITIGGWQMSSERARRFYFTTERDSYGAKLGQTANLGVIVAVFFRERRPIPVPITPPRPIYKDDSERSEGAPSRSAPSAKSQADQAARPKAAPDDDYAATGIGRSVRNDVRWVNMDLDSQPAAEISIRYEYYSALLKLGVVPRPYSEPDSLRRREQSRGFSPEP